MPDYCGVGPFSGPAVRESVSVLRVFEERNWALRNFARRFNNHWVIGRVGYRTPAAHRYILIRGQREYPAQLFSEVGCDTDLLLRQYSPAGTDLSRFTQAELDRLARRLNGPPRQMPGFKAPVYTNRRAVAITG